MSQHLQRGLTRAYEWSCDAEDRYGRVVAGLALVYLFAIAKTAALLGADVALPNEPGGGQ